MTLTPAYGREYKTQAAVLADFYAGQDFLTHSGPATPRAINVDQIPSGTTVQFRYAQMRKVLGHTVKRP